MKNKASKLMASTSGANGNMRVSEAGIENALRLGSEQHSIIDDPRAGIVAKLAKLGLAAGCALALSACVTPQEQWAMDQGQCYAFGFDPETDGFAECMMGLSQQRTYLQASRSLQLQAQFAEQNRRREAQQDLYKLLSLQRSGDRTFPVCGPSSDGGMDRRTMTWYGPNCRGR